MAERVTFPQSGDKNDAEYFAALAGQDNLASFVAVGMGFTVDYTVPEVTIGTGKAFIQLSTETASTSGGAVLKANHLAQVPQTTKSLSTSTTNHVYVEPNFQNDDNAEFHIYTNTSNSPSDALKIGEIDTANNTSYEVNRLPDISAGSYNSVRTLENPSPFELQEALNRASVGDRIEYYGDLTIGSGDTLNVTTDEIELVHVEGVATLNDDYIVVGGQSTQVSNVELSLSKIDGQDYSQSPRTAVTVDNAVQGSVEFRGPVEQCERLFYAHGSSNGKANDWDVDVPNVATQFQTAIELYGENADVEGISFYGGAIFNATKTIHIHGTPNNLGTSSVHGTTLHGSTASRNTDEILEQGNAANNTYIPRFVGDPSSLVRLQDGSNLLYRNQTELGRPGIRNDTISGTGDAFMDFIDSGGNRRKLFLDPGTDAIRLQADGSAVGSTSGVLQLKGDSRVDFIDDSGSTVGRFTGGNLSMQENDIVDINALDSDIAYVSNESQLRQAGNDVDTNDINTIILTSDITLTGSSFHPPTNSTNGHLYLNGHTLSIANGVNDNVVHIEGGDHWEIYGPGTIDGNKANQTDQADSTLQHGIRMRACQNPHIENVEIRNTFGGGASVIGNPVNATVADCEFHDCGSSNWTANNLNGGVDMQGGDRMTLKNCKMINCYSMWGLVRGGSGSRVDGCVMSECSGDGLTDPAGPQGGFVMLFVNSSTMSQCTGKNVSAASSGATDVCRVEDFYDGVMSNCIGIGAPTAAVRLGDDAHDSVMDGCVGVNSSQGLVIGGQSDGCVIDGGRAENNSLNGVNIKGGSDHEVHNVNTLNNANHYSDNGTRTVIDGWGENAGDPSSTGDWNGNGRPRIQLRDTTNNKNYVYINGGWEQL